MAREERKGTALIQVCCIIVDDFREQARSYSCHVEQARYRPDQGRL
ncbi:hypothetical protein C4K03_4881 [Pseudomonas synxantha]|uniref:Uncharacterized protein n=1 Tax=Pseudomonas synxantha TaxID=47883 RepID=A0A3G7UEN3_9PSED|nr:hypothetical protein C4K03_4881 [Pseudomonas synxantha]